MGRFLVRQRSIARIQPDALLILALFEQFQLPSHHQQFLLLCGQRLIECGDGILLESHLALEVSQLFRQLVAIFHPPLSSVATGR